MTNGPMNACPVCGLANAPDAVFCANPDCRKALGEFPFVLEELGAAAARGRWHETLAERVAGFIGRPHFFAVHLVWFVVWVALNTGLVAVIRRFDDYPFGLLGILLSAEAIFITGFLLISQNRQSALADRRATLDYEVNVRTYRRIGEIEQSLRALADRLDRPKGGETGAGAASPEPVNFS